ncbi:MAG TPA: ribonuclease III [Bacteroidales bacterium]|jgi:ribonuclease-3|nr:ribonuclease III [Bacteroidales bacterium]
MTSFRPTDKDSQDHILRKAIRKSFRFRPRNLRYYKIALTHRSTVSNNMESNERLEFLGDAVLGVVVGEAVYRRYPHADEGYLTRMRSKLVSRDSLNKIAVGAGMHHWLYVKGKDVNSRNLAGNMYEALAGAIFLDVGFEKSKKILLNHLLSAVDWQELEYTETDFKSRLVERYQKKGKALTFRVRMLPQKPGECVTFQAQAVTEGSVLGTGTGYSKKDAEQEASKQAWMNECNRGVVTSEGFEPSTQ